MERKGIYIYIDKEKNKYHMFLAIRFFIIKILWEFSTKNNKIKHNDSIINVEINRKGEILNYDITNTNSIIKKNLKNSKFYQMILNQ